MAQGRQVPQGKGYRCPPVLRVMVRPDRGSRTWGATVGFPVQLPAGVTVRLPMAVGDWPARAFGQMWNTSW